LKFNHIKIWV